MPTQTEEQSLNVIDNLDMGVDILVQSILKPLYESSYGDVFAFSIFGIPLAQLVSAILIFLLFLWFRKIFTNIVIIFIQNLAKKSTTYYDDRVVAALKAPIRFAFIVIGIHLFFLIIFQYNYIIKNILNSLIVYDIFWAIIALTEALRGLVYSAVKKFTPYLFEELGNFLLTLLRIFIIGIGLGAILQVWGINVTALIASLGIGGLAFALAAKDTVANLFASFSLLADKSIKIGEWIKVKEVEGTIEEIGMRTTKIRSFGKSLITVPNQIIANNSIENFSRRGIRRIKLRIGVTYDTNEKDMKSIVTKIKIMLKKHKEISQKDTILVNFEAFGDSSLTIFIYAFTATSNWEKYLHTKEDVHFKIMKIVETNNSSFAFPSQSLYFEQVPN